MEKVRVTRCQIHFGSNPQLLVPSRRDDMEAAALMFIHLLTPRGLSWTRNGVPKTSEAHNRLKMEKRNATPESLCRGLPAEFEEFLSYTRRLAFKECPDYAGWIERFRGLSKEEGYIDVDAFIWPPPAVPVSSLAIPYTSCPDAPLGTNKDDEHTVKSTNTRSTSGRDGWDPQRSQETQPNARSNHPRRPDERPRSYADSQRGRQN